MPLADDELPSAPRLVVSDPTQNVISMLEAAAQRQDDMRRIEVGHVRDLVQLRASHATDLRLAEAARIDAIRAVDVGAVNRAAEVSALQASTLANQVAVSAETLRGQVAAAAIASSQALSAALDPIQKDIADLRKAQYEAQGQKAQVVETRSGASLSTIITGVIVAAIVGSLGVAASITALILSR